MGKRAQEIRVRPIVVQSQTGYRLAFVGVAGEETDDPTGLPRLFIPRGDNGLFALMEQRVPSDGEVETRGGPSSPWRRSKQAAARDGVKASLMDLVTASGRDGGEEA